MHQTQKPKGHYSDERWSDYVRRLVDPGTSVLMKMHLDSGCAECQSAVQAFELLSSAAASDRAFEVPSALVSQAKAMFEPVAFTSWIERLEIIKAQFVASIDSNFQLAGVRSAATQMETSGDRILFRAGSYSVDLKIEPAAGGEGGEIIGQISSSLSKPSVEPVMDGVLVQLVSSPGKTLGETTTNRFGEFLIDYAGQKNVTLRFALKQQNQRIDVPLKLKGARQQ